MKRAVLSLVVALAAAALLSPAAAAGKAGRYIVVLRASADAPTVAAQHARSHGAAVSHVYEHALRGYAARLGGAAVARIERDARVAYVEPDLRVHAFAQVLPTGVDRIDGELSPTAKIDGLDDDAVGSVERVNVDVAVIDTGVQFNHPDLNVVAMTDCTGGGPFRQKCTDGKGEDQNGHGTHVAGTIGALDNGIGVVGVAPGARIHNVRVLDSRGSGYTSWIIAGIDWVTARASTIEVANMSLGGSGYTAAQHTAVKNSVAKGVVHVVAAGNSARDVYGPDGRFGSSDDSQPASYPEAMTISALADADGRSGGLAATSTTFSICTENRDDSFACFSNFSRSVVAGNPVVSTGGAIDLMLPGYLVYSTYVNGGYASSSGTSMASPHGAGLAALHVARYGRAANASGVAAVRQALIDAGRDQTGTSGLT
ncbi:MAG TPA: S8 family serine peptidase, partial [Actinomycetota bacterium]|nr:S8 family serine peptidase [Actinomycetota bacterium]